MTILPFRAGRTSYGPVMRDEVPVADPKSQIGAGPLNLLWWQSAGIAQTVPIAFVTLNAGGGSDILFAKAAFDETMYVNTNAAGVPWIASTTFGTGTYQVVFTSALGTLITASASLRASLGEYVYANPQPPLTIDCIAEDSAGVANITATIDLVVW